uniref:Uncharacterized protein n=1 Tax=Rhizophora mucronata TaxID=61149 RepID=A0A2P2Q324_RHIMU
MDLQVASLWCFLASSKN